MRTCAWLRLALRASLHKYEKEVAFWVRPALSQGKVYDSDELLIDLRNYDVRLSGELRSSFKNSFITSSKDFENLTCLVGPALNKKNTNFRNATSVTKRLAITLRLLATGDSYHSTI